jgi:2-octaprenyl-6-methoxyphenol hydroxylase
MITEHDVVIIGGGPIGLACALLLAQRGIGSCVLDELPLVQARTDARLLALSRGSWDLLDPLLAGQAPRRAPIREVHVSSGGDFGATRIGADDLGGGDLGATVFYGDLLGALAARADGQRLIEVRRPAQALEVRQRPDRVEVQLADGSSLDATLAVHAEGKVDGAVAGDGERALVGELRLRPARDGLAAGAAFERFTRGGPLALLPTPLAATDRAVRRLALVWCMSEADARRRLALDDPSLLAELQAEVGPRIGTVTSIDARRAVALPRRLRGELHGHRTVAIGNAAQTLHPVAGQGFNLGLRDCATLADELALSGLTPQALSTYARRRRIDRSAITLATRTLPGLFATGFAPLRLARSLGLALLDVAPPLRRELAALLMFGVRS